MKQVKITITTDGETKIEASGYSGDECIKDTAAIEAALGVTNEPRSRKLEANTLAVPVTQFNGGGK